MIRKLTMVFLAAFLVQALCGCWNYKGLDEITIVSGLAIDKVPGSNMYHLTFEIFDLANSSKDQGLKTILVESEGKGVFDAVRNARRQLASRMYFGNAEIFIISKELAESEDIHSILDSFLRDAEPRETTNIVISKEKTAKALLTTKSINSAIVSAEIKRNISEDHEIVSKSYDVRLYHVFDLLESEGIELTLPAFHSITSESGLTTESDGIAIFKGSRLAGFLPPDETKYFLYAINRAKGGTLVFEIKDFGSVSLEVQRVKTKRSFTFDDTFINFTIKPEVVVFINEISTAMVIETKEQLYEIAFEAEMFISERIRNIIDKVITEYDSDIFGFGLSIYKKDPELWRTLQKGDISYLRLMKFDVKPKVVIQSTGYKKQ